VTVEISPGGVLAVLQEPQALKALQKVGQTVVTEARRTAPRGAHPGRHFADTIYAGLPDTNSDGAEIEIFTTDPFWHLIEFGSAHNPPYRPLTRAVVELGLEFKDAR
jgi:Bacteriophage HK97-gp10, putative tail-component